jgi:hypothetical protein
MKYEESSYQLIKPTAHVAFLAAAWSFDRGSVGLSGRKIRLLRTFVPFYLQPEDEGYAR